jgi:hypothetical protein
VLPPQAGAAQGVILTLQAAAAVTNHCGLPNVDVPWKGLVLALILLLLASAQAACVASVVVSPKQM